MSSLNKVSFHEVIVMHDRLLLFQLNDALHVYCVHYTPLTLNRGSMEECGSRAQRTRWRKRVTQARIAWYVYGDLIDIPRWSARVRRVSSRWIHIQTPFIHSSFIAQFVIWRSFYRLIVIWFVCNTRSLHI